MEVALWGYRFEVDESRITESPAEVRRQVREYERGERHAFDLTVAVPDDFTGRVMDAMAAIPYGETRTYGDLAGELDTSPVAVGGACGRNPVPLVVPCHRVVGRDRLGGFSAEGGVDLKRALLAHEREHAGGERQASLAGYGANGNR
ncbi:methylated-DNA--[protein]-cysteine S-methyltransferase [Salinirubellus salinus]|uniref:Methylated-DNA--[protein]-cysteine S-methyltransferase n=1 Tax=Salinirubellus salinus TaxID=1364945 RepID=A0A9E7UB84_9EURY|nr:methylated-DNA--[protein]-cysteine S-methyltransferase [Salinirubellus salinus]UWM54812.1 methylated-DNA--[protein]-cysteine S-methyltransferase [Salinirubellus salinus]